MTKQRVFRRNHEVGIAALIEVPAVAIAFCFDDADLLEFLQAAAAASRLGVELAEAVDVTKRILRRIFDIRIVDLEFVQQ